MLVGGAVGTGKTTLAAALADRLGAVVLSSDRLRKQRLGLAAGKPAPDSAYSLDAKAEIYRSLLEQADAVVSSGRVAVLDASWGARRERIAAQGWASARQLRAWFVETRCEPGLAESRLAERARAGRDPSDAGPQLHAASRAGFEPPDEWPAARRRIVFTDEPSLRDDVESIVAEIRPIPGM